jgi:hypothetical protein
MVFIPVYKGTSRNPAWAMGKNREAVFPREFHGGLARAESYGQADCRETPGIGGRRYVDKTKN